MTTSHTASLPPQRVADDLRGLGRLAVDGDLVLLYYGHASPWKGLHILAEALPQVLREQPRAQRFHDE